MISVTLARAQWRHVLDSLAFAEVVQDDLLGRFDYGDEVGDAARRLDGERGPIRLAIRNAMREADDAAREAARTPDA